MREPRVPDGDAQPWVAQEPRWRGPRLSLCSRVSIHTPTCREILSAAFKEQVGLPRVLLLGVGVRRLGTIFPKRSGWLGHCSSKQKTCKWVGSAQSPFSHPSEDALETASSPLLLQLRCLARTDSYLLRLGWRRVTAARSEHSAGEGS